MAQVRFVFLFCLALLGGSSAFAGPMDITPGAAEYRGQLKILIVKRQQLLWVYENGQVTGNWAVSTGTEEQKCSPTGQCYKASTPIGRFRPQSIHQRAWSEMWQANLDFVIYFKGEYALHATGATALLGSRQSGGCIRQSPPNARRLFQLVQAYGIENTEIEIYE